MKYGSSPQVNYDKSKDETLFLDLQGYKKTALRLYDKHAREILAGDDERLQYGSHTIANVLHDHFPPYILEHYVGHGSVRYAGTAEIASLLSILDNNVIIGDMAGIRQPPEFQGTLSAYLNGGFLVISRKDARNFVERQSDGRPKRIDIDMGNGKLVRGTKLNESTLVCNLGLDALVPELRRLFPERDIIGVSELVAYIRAQEEGASA